MCRIGQPRSFETESTVRQVTDAAKSRNEELRDCLNSYYINRMLGFFLSG